MLNSEKFKHIEIRVKQYILALTLLMSFFATPGYVNNGEKMIGVVNTEVLAARPVILKNGITLKRAFIAATKRNAPCIQAEENLTFGLRSFNQIISSRRTHLKRLFGSYKSAILYTLISPAHHSQSDFSYIG